MTPLIDDGIVVEEVGKWWTDMPAARYPRLLAERLGDNGCLELVEMLDERDRELLSALDERSRLVGQRFDAIDRRFDTIDHRFDLMVERSERRLAEECGKLRVEMHDGFGGLRVEMANQRADLLKWAMVFWISQAAAVAAIVAVLR